MDNVADLPFKLTSSSSCPECHKPIKYGWPDTATQFVLGRCPYCDYVLVFVSLPFHVCGRMGPTVMRAQNPNTIGLSKETAMGFGIYIDVRPGLYKSHCLKSLQRVDTKIHHGILDQY